MQVVVSAPRPAALRAAEFLRAALDLRFFPELWDVRTEIGR